MAGTVMSKQGMDPFGYLVVQQRKLLDNRDKLISEIQAFLKPS